MIPMVNHELILCVTRVDERNGLVKIFYENLISL